MDAGSPAVTHSPLPYGRPMATLHERRIALRALLQGRDCVRPATAYDPLSALAAQSLGYPLGILAGSIASLAVLGAPDIALLSLSDLVEQVRRVCRASDLPIMVDGDHGYGNALNVRRMVADIEAAGAAAVSVEDTVLPAAFGAGEATQLIPVAELTGKLRAAVDARQDEAFVIMGRTATAHARDRADLLARIAAIHDAGVDALFVVGVRQRADLEAIAAAATLPIVLGALPVGMDTTMLADLGVRICLQGHAAYYDGLSAVHARLAQQRQGTAQAAPEDGTALARRLSGEAQHDAWARDYLSNPADPKEKGS